MYVPFNKPFLSGKELLYIKQAVKSGKISGDGIFTKKCHDFFENIYGFNKVLLTTSCTDALEMCAILSDIKEGDEIIAPSYSFVSTVNPFIMRGAKIIFADSNENNPNIDPNEIDKLITNKTKALIIVHYAGIACDMKKISDIVKKYKLLLIEDAAQAVNSYFANQPLGSFGNFGCISFHETKNIISGEGGMIIINDKRFIKRAEIIREKGTNRSAFFRGEINKYGWIDIGSSFLPSDIIAAFLYAQIENLQKIQNKRKKIWNYYKIKLEKLEKKNYLTLPVIPKYTTNNAHIFYILCKNTKERNGLINYLKQREIHAVFHYLSLHKSAFFKHKHNNRILPNADKYSECLLRLPIYYELKRTEQDYVIDQIYNYYSFNN